MRRALQMNVKFLLALLVFSSLAWAADVPWKGKPYDQWDDKNIQKVFTDSPWARTATVTRTWVTAAQKDQPNGPLAAGQTRLPADPRSPDYSTVDELNFHVFWASSRVMRAASARKAVLHGGKQDLDANKYASAPQEECQIVVQSEDMSPFVRHDEQFFQANAFLVQKKSKQKIVPSHVQYERDEKRQVTAAVFFIPKKTAVGAPTLVSTKRASSSTASSRDRPCALISEDGG